MKTLFPAGNPPAEDELYRSSLVALEVGSTYAGAALVTVPRIIWTIA